MKFTKLFKQNRMATEWGPIFKSPDTLPYPLRVKRGVLNQINSALRLATGNPNAQDTDANRIVAGLVEQHLSHLQSLLRDGSDIAQFQVPLHAPLPLVLHIAYADQSIWVTDQPLLPYPPTKSEE